MVQSATNSPFESCQIVTTNLIKKVRFPSEKKKINLQACKRREAEYWALITHGPSSTQSLMKDP